MDYFARGGLGFISLGLGWWGCWGRCKVHNYLRRSLFPLTSPLHHSAQEASHDFQFTVTASAMDIRGSWGEIPPSGFLREKRGFSSFDNAEKGLHVFHLSGLSFMKRERYSFKNYAESWIHQRQGRCLSDSAEQTCLLTCPYVLFKLPRFWQGLDALGVTRGLWEESVLASLNLDPCHVLQ